MYVKLIRCRVALDLKERFSRGQLRWSGLAGVPGFVAQVGGWSRRDEAVILAVWQDQPSYVAFMRDVHDAVFEGGEQPGSYHWSKVTLWPGVTAISGHPSVSSPRAWLDVEVLRLTRCVVPETAHRAHFEERQRRIWAPSMASNEGMRGGIFCRNEAEYLVVTGWQTAASHTAWRHHTFPSAWGRAKDAESSRPLVVSGSSATLQLLPEWRVVACSIDDRRTERG